MPQDSRKVTPIQPFLQPIRKSLWVTRPPEEAFRLFTEGIATWWPLASHSLSGDRATTCVLEPRVGGLAYEVRDDGTRLTWAEVHAWEPPRRLVLSWHPGREPSTAQEVEILFSAEGSGTRVDLEHRGWQALADRASETQAGYDSGWDLVLGRCYGGAAGAVEATS